MILVSGPFGWLSGFAAVMAISKNADEKNFGFV